LITNSSRPPSRLVVFAIENERVSSVRNGESTYWREEPDSCVPPGAARGADVVRDRLVGDDLGHCFGDRSPDRIMSSSEFSSSIVRSSYGCAGTAA